MTINLNMRRIIKIAFFVAIFIFIIFPGHSMFGVDQAHASTLFSVSADTINGYYHGCWYCDQPQAPGSMQIFLYAGGNFSGATAFQYDCNNNGNWQSGDGQRIQPFNPGDYTEMIQWSNGYGWGGTSWSVYPYGVDISQEETHWSGLNITCNYQTGGTEQVNFIATRNGVKATGSITFYMQQTTYTFWTGFPASGAYYPPQPASTGIQPSKAPSNIDLVLAMQESGRRYQNDYYAWGFSPGFSYQTDCTNSGNFTGKSGGSNDQTVQMAQGTGTIYWTGVTLVQGICYYQNPGSHTFTVRVTDPIGATHDLPVTVFLASSQPLAINLYPAGQAPNQNAYIVDVNKASVPLDMNISGLTPQNDGSYDTSIDCGNGTTVGGPSANGRNYSTTGTLSATNLGPCVYSTPGIYTVKATFQEYKPASDPLPAVSGTGTAKIVVTSQSSVASPFYLTWDVSGATSCSISGPSSVSGSVIFPQSGLPASHTIHDISEPLGSYKYDLTCDNGSGTPAKSEIGVNVIYVMLPK